MLDLLEINTETPLPITTDGKSLIVSRFEMPRGKRPFAPRFRKVTDVMGGCLSALPDPSSYVSYAR